MYQLQVLGFNLFHDRPLISNLKHQSQDHTQNHNKDFDIYFVFKHAQVFFPKTVDSKHTESLINITILVDYPINDIIVYPIYEYEILQISLMI
jgi:hypothetical protein